MREGRAVGELDELCECVWPFGPAEERGGADRSVGEQGGGGGWF